MEIWASVRTDERSQLAGAFFLLLLLLLLLLFFFFLFFFFLLTSCQPLRTEAK